jgi:hypothetical protein
MSEKISSTKAANVRKIAGKATMMSVKRWNNGY